MKADLDMDWQQVRNNLSDNEIAIEFIDYQKFNQEWTDTTLYAALLVRKNWESPVFVPLFEESQIDLLLTDNNPNLDKRIAKLYNGGNPRFYNGQKLYQLIWQPLEQYLSDIKTVYYSPSGLLNQISFAAIPTDTVLLSDKYDLHLVSSTREVVREKKNKETFLPVKQAVEYGGIVYDVENPQELQTAARSYKNDSIPMFASRSLSADSTRSGWIYLQGAENEVREIESILQKSKVPNIKYMGVSANEESFKSLSGHSPELLHIATHGFFLQDEKEIRQTGFMQMLGNENRSYINPLLRSGLLFAGANRAWKNENIIPDIEDGILTAEEISQLNLSKTKLVVLSACETALGEVQNSEGVFGLQRAFKLAGVETLVMSLWKVNDAATKDFMITFYQNLMAGKSKRQSFKSAQTFVREKHQNPYYWAAFVMMD
jgi:CHAT domain-containing protein